MMNILIDKNKVTLKKFVLGILIYLVALIFVNPLNTFAVDYPVTTEYVTADTLDKVKSNFSLSGSATWSDPWTMLTPDKTNQVGSIYLNNKILTSQDFSVNGTVAVTLKRDAAIKRNGDGIGLVFHTGDMAQIGKPGGNLGIVGLPNAIGLVVDTYQNAGEPEAPYIGIWSTDANGNKTVNQTYGVSLKNNAYNELNYTFTYSAASRTLRIQLYYSDGTPIFTSGSGLGYEIEIQDKILQYAFSITGATGGNSNYQYAKIATSNIPILKTNTPQVINEVSTKDTVTLTLTDGKGLNYPSGTVVFINDSSYIINDTSNVSIPISSISNITEPLIISVQSFKYLGTTKLQAQVSDEIKYTLVSREVTMTVNYIDKKDKKAIFSDAMTDSSIKSVDTFSVMVGSTILKNLTEKLANKELLLDYTGYDKIDANSFVFSDNEGNQITTVPAEDFTINYFYSPQTKLLEVPKTINFGGINSSKILYNKNDFSPINSLPNIKILNTDRTVNWSLNLGISTEISRNTDGQLLIGNIFFQKSDLIQILISPEGKEIASQTVVTPYQEVTVSKEKTIDGSGIGIKVDYPQKEFLGDYQGSLKWDLTMVSK